jgi:hypothetical protein
MQHAFLLVTADLFSALIIHKHFSESREPRSLFKFQFKYHIEASEYLLEYNNIVHEYLKHWSYLFSASLLPEDVLSLKNNKPARKFEYETNVDTGEGQFSTRPSVMKTFYALIVFKG